MDRSRRGLLLIWLATTAAVAVAALVAYRAVVRVPELAGRTAPEALLEEPVRLLDDPGLIGTAVEIRVTRAITACMASRGFTYRGPAAVEGLDETLDPAVDGYGIATGPAGGAVTLGDGGAGRYERDAYEQALYGSSLDEGGTGGCAAVGAAELQASLDTIASMPYSIEQFEADMAAHPDMVAGLAGWSACMAGKGYTAASPDDLMADLAERLSRATAEEARALAEEERRTAIDDFACRETHLAPAVEAVAEELAPAFVAANRPQLESLMPPEPVEPGEVTVPTDLGTGDVQVTLLWTAPVDLDLRVTDPTGSYVDYQHRSSSSGGQLDRDANRACGGIVADPVENVFWPEGEAPRGGYAARVTLYSHCQHDGPIEFTVVVHAGGRVILQEQRTFGDENSVVVEFEY